MSSGSGANTEKPTRKRLTEARKLGHVASSSLLTPAVLVLLLAVLLNLSGNTFADFFRDGVSTLLGDQGETGLISIQTEFLWSGFYVLLPLLIVVWIAAVVVSFLFVAREFSFGSPFSRRSGSRVSAKFAFEKVSSGVFALSSITFVFLVFVTVYAEDMALLPTLSNERLSVLLILLTQRFLMLLGIVLLAAGVVEYMLAVWSLNRSLAMSKAEVAAEQRENEMSAQVRSTLERNRRSLIKESINTTVPNSALVIVGPDSAFAIGYDPTTGFDPVLSGVGFELKSTTIRKIAETNNVPQIEDPELAGHLGELKVGETVPEKYFESLAHAFRIAGIKLK